MTKLKQEWKTKWIEALRSGQYNQGKKCLRSADDYFCCLGVLCDLVDQSRWSKNAMIIGGINQIGYEYDSSISYDNLPIDIRTTVFENYDCRPYRLNVLMRLINLNDVDNHNFNQIADYIEENL